MITPTVKEFLEHHGTKGMKWGVRKARGDRSAFKKRGTERTKFEKSPKRMTSSELEKRIRRMEIEKRYNELNKRDVSKGEALASEILTNSGRKVATTVVAGAGLLAVRTILTKKMGAEAANLITSKK